MRTTDLMDRCLTSNTAYVAEVARVLQLFDCDTAEKIAAMLFKAYETGAGIFIFGNGGSAALASHFACDLAKTATLNSTGRLRVLALTDNVPLLSAWSNDSGYEHVFAEQLRNFISHGDVAIAISCSGTSPNVIRGLELARSSGARTVGITGKDGGRMKSLCDLCMVIRSANVQIVEDLHVVTMHSVVTVLRNRIANAQRLGIHTVARVV
jgi:D-sedoheptulose 7-phosphate isomerase